MVPMSGIVGKAWVASKTSVRVHKIRARLQLWRKRKQLGGYIVF